MLQFFLLILTTALFAEKPSYFSETLYPSWGQTFTVDREILHNQTEHQDMLVFENEIFGKVLALDGVIQLTEADESIYHEMIVHLPLLTYGSPSSVLIIGGGDGGSLREVLKHPSIKRVVLVDIDGSVIAFSKQYFPFLSNGSYDDPRVEVIIQDAAEYVGSTDELFDVIICDSTDPIGPGRALFREEFYGGCRERLSKDGIFVNQSGVPFLQKNQLPKTAENLRPHFKNVHFYVAPIPTYVGGFMAFGWASDIDYQISQEVLQDRFEQLGICTFYYTPAIHKASFALPNFICQILGKEN